MAPAIHIGNAPCSWGSLEFEGMQGKSIGYTQMLDELRDTGYTGSELIGDGATESGGASRNKDDFAHGDTPEVERAIVHMEMSASLFLRERRKRAFEIQGYSICPVTQAASRQTARPGCSATIPQARSI